MTKYTHTNRFGKRNRNLFLLAIAILVIGLFPTNEAKAQRPYIRTLLNSSSIDCNSALVKGEYRTYSRWQYVRRSGFVWSSNPNPTISDSRWVNRRTRSPFTHRIGDLCPGTTYYARTFVLVLDRRTGRSSYFYGNNVRIITSSPTFTVSLSPNELWPPNHKLRTIEATISSDMSCTGMSYELTSITSNEDDDGLGDGDTPNDIQNASTGSEDYEFDLRAERSGTGDGRVYTVTYTITDACGAEYTASAEVTVPKSKGKSKETFNNMISENSIGLYPNPTTKNINLDMNFIYKSNATVSISDLTGRLITSFERYDVDTIQEQIDVANLVPGNYIISVQFGEETFVRRFVKF